MQFPLIRVRDKDNGREHIVGTDTHDSLYIDDDGSLHYHNYQNGEGSGASRKYAYEFVGAGAEWAERPQIEFIEIDKLLDIYVEQTKLDAEREKDLREFAKAAFAKWEKEIEQSEADGFRHS